MGISITDRDVLLVGVVALGANLENILPRAHQNALAKGPVEAAQREIGVGLGDDIECQRAGSEQKEQQCNHEDTGDTCGNLSGADPSLFASRLTQRLEGGGSERFVRLPSGWRKRIRCQFVVMITHKTGYIASTQRTSTALVWPGRTSNFTRTSR